MVKPRAIFLDALKRFRQAQLEKEEAVRKLNKYLEGLKKDDDFNYKNATDPEERVQMIEGEIC